MSDVKEQVHVVMTIARQVQGEYIWVRANGGFRQATKADELVKQLAKEFVDQEGKPKLVQLSTPNGEVASCSCEVGAFTIDLE